MTHKNVKRDFDGIHDEAKVLGHFASEDDAAYRHFKRAALRLQTHVVFYAIIDPTLAKLARKIKVGTARLSLPYGAGSHALDDPTAFFATIARLRKSQVPPTQTDHISLFLLHVHSPLSMSPWTICATHTILMSTIVCAWPCSLAPAPPERTFSPC